ncbi:MAG: DUF92 domain-containing protein [Terriglobales bacterium]
MLSLSLASWHQNGVHMLWFCLFVTAAFAALAFVVRAVSRSGAIVGAFVCFSLCACVGSSALAGLLAVFAMAWLGTKIGYQKKLRLGTAEEAAGRTGFQILANLGVAAGCAILYAFTGKAIFLFAIAASLSEAAADTVSSEMGQLSGEKTRLITDWREVNPGTDGGVTLFGTVSGLLAAAVVTSVCGVGGMISWNRIGISILAAFCGMIADSFLGALLERRKLVNNDMVNFLGTLIAALIAVTI